MPEALAQGAIPGSSADQNCNLIIPKPNGAPAAYNRVNLCFNKAAPQ
jgi:hypothetical protein